MSDAWDRLANQAAYATGEAYSHRGGVNVLLGIRAYPYPPNTKRSATKTRGATTAREYVRECVKDAAREYSRDKYRDGDPLWDVTISEDYTRRGRYTFTVWMPKGNQS